MPICQYHIKRESLQLLIYSVLHVILIQWLSLAAAVLSSKLMNWKMQVSSLWYWQVVLF